MGFNSGFKGLRCFPEFIRRDRKTAIKTADLQTESNRIRLENKGGVTLILDISPEKQGGGNTVDNTDNVHDSCAEIRVGSNQVVYFVRK